MDGGRSAEHPAQMETIFAGLALWAAVSVLLAAVWVVTAEGAARRAGRSRRSLVLPTPRPAFVDLTEAADVDSSQPLPHASS
jgi:hypothetical protein